MKPDPLKSTLREEAALNAPAFSPLLHERIMARLRADGSVPVSRRPDPRRWFIPLGAAAALLVAASAYIALRPAAITPLPRATAHLPTPDDLAKPVAALWNDAAAPAGESLEQARYAYLDQDAKRLMLFVADQFPSPPAAAEPPHPPQGPPENH